MPTEEWSPLRDLRIPPPGEATEFAYSGHSYCLTSAGSEWILERVDDTSMRAATLFKADDHWVLVPAEHDGEWFGGTHFLAIEAFLDDNDAWEEYGR